MPRIADLFCGAGGAAMGLHRAGFEVVGFDIKPQPRYPFEFHQQDALTVDLSGFDAVWASPPCQGYSRLQINTKPAPKLVGVVRLLLRQASLPYIIENVPGAPLFCPNTLCGSSFGLPIWRHRIFETNPHIVATLPCNHKEVPKPLDITGTGGPCPRHRKPKNMQQACEAMGIDWMKRDELTQAIPPAYSEYLGRELIKCLRHHT